MKIVANAITRKTLIQLLIELEHSGLGRNKEQASKLLGHLVANAPKLIRPYVEPILKVGISRNVDLILDTFTANAKLKLHFDIRKAFDTHTLNSFDFTHFRF